MNDKIKILKSNIEQRIVGKGGLIDNVITTLLAGGHLLIEDVPGVGKYVSLAPDDIRPDLRSVFDTYYRVIYGGNPAVSEGENELARKVRGRLKSQLRTKNLKAGS